MKSEINDEKRKRDKNTGSSDVQGTDGGYGIIRDPRCFPGDRPERPGPTWTRTTSPPCSEPRTATADACSHAAMKGSRVFCRRPAQSPPKAAPCRSPCRRAGHPRYVTIVTNSAFIADYIRSTSANIVLLGGIYQNDSQCLVGPMVRDGAMNYHVQYCMVGTDGWSERTGFTNKDQMRAQAVRDLSASADQIVILTESEKFGVAGTVPLNISPGSSVVITDAALDEETRNALQEKGMKVILSE